MLALCHMGVHSEGAALSLSRTQMLDLHKAKTVKTIETHEDSTNISIMGWI